MFEVVDWASIVGGGLGSKFDVGGGIELAGSGINAVDGTWSRGLASILINTLTMTYDRARHNVFSL